MADRKDTNPKDAVGIAKVPFSTVPERVLAELGLAMLEGARKYGRHNYRVSGVRASVYYDALVRHVLAWWAGQDIDPASGLPHLIKAMACACVVRDSQIQGNWVDDRPPRQPGHETWIDELNAKAKALLDRYPEPVEAWTQQRLEGLRARKSSSKAPPRQSGQKKQRSSRTSGRTSRSRATR